MNQQKLRQLLPAWLSSGWTTVLFIALGASVAQAFGRFSYGLLLPAVRDDMVMTNTQAGLIGATNVGAYLLGTVVVAWATSQFRLLNVMRLGLVLATVGLFIASTAASPLMLAAGLFIAGLGGAFVWIPAPIIAADALPVKQRSMAVGLLGSGIGLGIVFVSVLGGALRSTQGDHAWSNVYQIQFGIGLMVLAGTLLIVRHQQAAPSGGGGIGGFSALQRTPGWLPLILAYATFGFMYLLVIGFLTTRLEDDSGWSASNAALAFTLMGFAMIFGGPTFVTIANRFGTRMALSLAFGLWPLVVGVVLTGVYLPTLIACLALGFLFSGLPSLITLYVVENTTAKDFGPAFAAATLAFGISQTVSPPIGGFIADISGSFTLVFLLAGAMGIVGLIASMKLPSHQQKSKT